MPVRELAAEMAAPVLQIAWTGSWISGQS